MVKEEERVLGDFFNDATRRELTVDTLIRTNFLNIIVISHGNGLRFQTCKHSYFKI